MATYSSTLAWKIPWIEELGGLQSMGSDTTQHTLDYLDRMAGPAVCLRPRQRRVRSPKWWFGCQRILHNLCCWTRVTYISPRFHNHHAFLWVWSWWGRVHAGGKLTEPSHCQTGESLRKSARGVSGSTHTYPSPGFLTLTARALAEGSQRALVLLGGSASRLASPAFSSPGLPRFVLSYPDTAFGIHHRPHICYLWPRWSFKVPTNLASSWVKSLFDPANVWGTFLVAYPDCISLFISDFYSDSHTFSIHFWAIKKADCTPNSRNGSDLLE